MRIKYHLGNLQLIALWLWTYKCYPISLVSLIFTITYILFRWNFLPNGVSAFTSIIGLGFILYQLTLDARQFADNDPKTIHKMIASYPIRKPIEIHASASLQMSTGLQAHAVVSIKDDASIEQKVDFLIRQNNSIQNILNNLDDQINAVDSKIAKTSTELMVEIEKTSNKLNTSIAGHAVGAYDLTFLGIVLTFCGILLQL